MKNIPVILAIASSFLILGCSSAPVVLEPVGPSPFVHGNTTEDGELEVFSAMQARRDEGGDSFGNPGWQQHTDYDIYSREGKRIKHVANTVGHYAEAPRVISLPPGSYIVKAQATDYASAEIPVVIRGGVTTVVHLDNGWKGLDATSVRELVNLPNGHPVGWRDKEGTENK